MLATGYNTLEKVHDAEQWDMATQATALLEHLVDTPLTNYFGICRLHKHFEVAEDECVVTHFIENGFYSKVQKFSTDYLPWLWKYSEEEMKWIPMEYLVPPPNCQTFDADQVGTAIVELLKGQGGNAFKMFGLCLNIATIFGFTLPQGYVLREQTDHETKEQWTLSVPKEEIVDEVTFLTRWFKGGIIYLCWQIPKDDSC